MARFRNNRRAAARREAIMKVLGEKLRCGLNFAPATPPAVNAERRADEKLGLDLRGAVAFSIGSRSWTTALGKKLQEQNIVPA